MALWRKLLVEFLGTYFVVIVFTCVQAYSSPIAALAVGFVFMAMMYAGYNISGGHLNPAITLAVYIRNRIQLGEMILYWMAQIFGGLIAALVGWWFTGCNAASLHLVHGANNSAFVGMLAEADGTLALSYVMLLVATSKRNAGNSFYGMATGLTLFAVMLAFDPTSGGSFNPATGISLNLMELIITSTLSSSFWIYIVGPVIGAITGAVVFNLLNPDDK